VARIGTHIGLSKLHSFCPANTRFYDSKNIATCSLGRKINLISPFLRANKDNKMKA